MSAARPERRRRWRGLLTVACWAVAAGAFAGAEPTDPEQARSELQALRERIEAIKDRLDSAREQESELARSLQQVETRLSRTTRELARTREQLQSQQQRLQELRTRRSELGELLSRHRQGLRQYLRTAYMLGRHESIKLLLNQEDPQRLGRTLTYYRYLSEARAAAMEQARQTLVELQTVEASITEQLAELEHTRGQHRRQRQALESQHAERARLLADLRRRIQDDTGRLARLQKDEARLEQLIADLRAALADVQHLDRQRKPFAELQASLPWPTAGELRNRFGQSRGLGNLRWRGVFIAAAPEQPVRSISHGRVAFADWLRGFGLLLIIDHGDGFMSLYGHTRALFKDVGDWVENDEIVAQVGSTGGLADTGLYFELRRDGEPIDPLKWCAGRPPPQHAAAR